MARTERVVSVENGAGTDVGTIANSGGSVTTMVSRAQAGASRPAATAVLGVSLVRSRV